MAKSGRNGGGSSAAPVVTTKPKATAEAGEVQLVLPVGGGEQAGYQRELVEAGEVSMETGTHLNVQVGPRGAKAFVSVRNGLRDAGARLKDGRPVYTNADALRFILDLIADSLDAAK